MKICYFCGHGTVSSKCHLCKYDHNDKYGELETLDIINPFDRRYIRGRYSNWIQRMDILLELFSSHLESAKCIIDVGCGPNVFCKTLKSKWPGRKIKGYDKNPLDNDVENLYFEKQPLPYADNSVDFSLMSHVIEHIENIHFALSEVFRVSKTVAIVLPNQLNIFKLARFGLGTSSSGLLGLPFSMPLDRHRWFFSMSESDDLIGYYCYKYEMKYKAIYLSHDRVPCHFARINRNLFSKEVIYICEK